MVSQFITTRWHSMISFWWQLLSVRSSLETRTVWMGCQCSWPWHRKNDMILLMTYERWLEDSRKKHKPPQTGPGSGRGEAFALATSPPHSYVSNFTVLWFCCNKYFSASYWSALWRKFLGWGWCSSPTVWYGWWRLLGCPGSWTWWYWCRTGNPQWRFHTCVILSVCVHGSHIFQKTYHTWCLLLSFTLSWVLSKVHNRDWACSLQQGCHWLIITSCTALWVSNRSSISLITPTQFTAWGASASLFTLQLSCREVCPKLL